MSQQKEAVMQSSTNKSEDAPQASRRDDLALLKTILSRLELLLQRWNGYDEMKDDSVFAAQAQTVLAILRDAPHSDREADHVRRALRSLQKKYPLLRNSRLDHYVNQAIEYISRK